MSQAGVISSSGGSGGAGAIPWNFITTINTTSGSSVSFTSARIVNYNNVVFVFSVNTSLGNGLQISGSTNGGVSYTVGGIPSFQNTITNPFGIAVTSTGNGWIQISNSNLNITHTFIGHYNLLGFTSVAYTGYFSASVQLNAFQFTTVGGDSFTGGSISM